MVTNKEFTEWADWEGGLISLVIYHGVDINELEDQRLAFLVGQLKMKWDEHIAPLIDEINTICL